jgi:hypothetical protein
MNGEPVISQPLLHPGRFGGHRPHARPGAFLHAMYADVLDGNNRYGGDRHYGNNARGYPEA